MDVGDFLQTWSARRLRWAAWLMGGIVTATVVASLFHEGAEAGVELPLPPCEPAALAPAAIVVHAKPVARLDHDGAARFVFAHDTAKLAGNAEQVLAEIAQGIAQGKRAEIASFYEPTLQAMTDSSLDLAQRRADAVQQALLELAVPTAQLHMQAPKLLELGSYEMAPAHVQVQLIDETTVAIATAVVPTSQD